MMVFLLFVSGVSNAQDAIDHQVWFDAMPHFEINDRLKYFGDISYRTSTNKDKFRRFVLRPSLFYAWTKEVDIIGGLSLFLTWEEENYNTIEFRPYQGIGLTWPKIWHLDFKHQGLIEQRFLWNNEGDFDPNLRLRYKILTKLPINKTHIENKALYLPISYEIFANIGPKEVERFQNLNEAIVGMGYKFNDKWIGEIEVIFQRTRNSSTEDLILSNRIIRFKLIYHGWILGE